MADRQDIDALLIGALYGELDDDERARLETHLASHPQDRSALDGLRSTRQLLREADLPTTMAVAEPSPAITAMLLQEAARRAPARASGGGFFAFLAGLLKPFAASPALSAAAALVLVGGAAGLLYSRGTFRTSEPSVGADRMAQVESRDTLDKGELAPGGAAAAAPMTPPAAVAGNVDDYRVALADGENVATGSDGVDRGLVTGGLEEQQEALAKENERKSTGDAIAAKGKRAGMGAGGSGGAAFQSSSPTATAKLDSASRAGGAQPGYLTIEGASKDDPTVLALDGSRAESAAESKNRIAAEGDSDRSVVADKAPAKKSAAPPPPPAAAGSSAPQKPIAGKDAAPQQVARDQGKGGTKAYDATKAAALDAWARDQHARMVKLVNAGKCTDAGTIGAEIARRNPDYYQANVANDRAVRACRSYVDRARRAKSEDAKTKAAAPRNNAPDSPYEADLESAK